MQHTPAMLANLYALGAISLWGTLAALGLELRGVPPFLVLSQVTILAMALIIGGAVLGAWTSKSVPD